MLKKVTENTPLLILNNTQGLGPVKIFSLVKHFQTPSNVLKASQEQLLKVPGISKNISERILLWRKNSLWKKDLALVQKESVKLLSFQSCHYPQSLLKVKNPPPLLYVKGKLDVNLKPTLALVGSRKCSQYGKDIAYSFSEKLAQKNIVIISGLARGIDTQAHMGAIKSGETIAIIGSGLSHIYPSENMPLAKKIVEKTCLISELPMFTAPDKKNFPRRNRIISGMSDATFLVEAPEKSGAMLTAQFCLEQKKTLFALPGRIDQESFKGNHLLIYKNQAKLVRTIEDFYHFFKIPNSFNINTNCGPMLSLSLEERQFLLKIPSEEISIEKILQLTDLPIAKLNFFLTKLILKKAIKELPGKLYKKILL